MSEETTAQTTLTPDTTDSGAKGEPSDLQAEEQKPAGTPQDDKDTAALKGAPQTYEEFAIPDGMTVDGDALDSFTPLARDLGLTQAQAQQLVDFYVHRLNALESSQMEQVAQVRKGWVEGIKADDEIGGLAMGEKVALAVKALDRFGTQKLRKTLEESGLGDHPEMVRVFYRIGKSMAEDEIQGGAGAQPAADQRTAAEILYPNQGKS